MKKLFRSASVGLLGLVAATSVTGCKWLQKLNNTSDLSFWSSFGAAYTSTLDGIVDEYEAKAGVSIEHISKGSYDGVKEAMISTLAGGDYPNMCTGYPDHFAEYIGNEAVVELDKYLDSTALNDYYPEYMEECYNLQHDAQGNRNLMALPFNKSTELMGYNGVFVDYCASLSNYASYDLGVVPKTWQEWTSKGPIYREIQVSLCGKYLVADQATDGKASNFRVITNESEYKTYKEASGKCGLDFSTLTANDCRVISWDSTDNMFITLVRQWGGTYTELPESEWQKTDPRKRHGYVRFWDNDNKATTIACLKYFNKMNIAKVFGVPGMFGASYSSKAFEANKVMFMLCSSGGLSYNTTNWNQRFRVAPLPYNADKTNCKYVISQGADLAVMMQGDADTKQKAVNAALELTRGDLQAKWCVATGYYPASKSAANSSIYQSFLNDKSYDNATKVAYREGSNINQSYYMNSAEGWKKFVDDAFIGSAEIRTKIKNIFGTIFEKVGSGDVENDSKYISEVDTIYATISKDVKA